MPRPAPRNPYEQFRHRELTLNDHLAIDRTVLANERTILAYARTALAMLIIGGSAIKFFDSAWMLLVGVPFIIAGIAVMAWGWSRYRRTQRVLHAALAERTGSTEHPLEDQATPPHPK
jgi:putative membrane protein